MLLPLFTLIGCLLNDSAGIFFSPNPLTTPDKKSIINKIETFNQRR